MIPTADSTNNCCYWRGLLYPGGDKRCYRHATADQLALTAELDQRASALGITGRQGWPYGPNVDVEARQGLLNWAERYELRLADTRCQELHWLRSGRCRVQICNRLGGWMDHVTMWTRHGNPALVLAQPYHLGDQDVAELGRLAVDDELRISVGRGWYGHGTVSVEVWRRDSLPTWDPS